MKLTLSQAQQRLAHYGDLKIDWTKPAEEACRIALAANDFRLRRAEVEAIHEALMAYAAHLAFQEGKAFEAAAVKRTLAEHVREEKGDAKAALVGFGLVVNSGLHYADPAENKAVFDAAIAEQQKGDVRMGDVWRIGLMVASDAEVRCVHPETGNLTVAALHGDRRHKVVSAAKFTSNRRLVRRDGKAVPDET